MSEEAPLVALLRRIRRRLRLRGAIEGAVAGGAAGAAAAAVATAIVHHRGGAVGTVAPALAVVGGVAVGAAVRALRRIPLDRCARFADGALEGDRDGDGEDRILSALYVAGLGGAGAGREGRPNVASTPLGRALIADAVGRLGALAPARAVPTRRPRAAPALGLAALALVAAALSPVRSRAALAPATPPTVARRTPVAAPLLDVEREAARAAAEAARRLQDARLAALAAELEATVRRLAAGTMGDGEALDAVRLIEARAAEAARDAERDGQALEAARQALEKSAATRAAGQALTAGRNGEAGADARTQAELGAGAEGNPSETGRALAAAARGVEGSSGGNEPGLDAEKRERRLARERPQEGDGDKSTDGHRDRQGPGERRLEKLSRDLDDTASRCKDGSPDCRAEAEKRARDLSKLARSAAGGEALRRLERAARQMRGRMGRGEMSGDGADARRFARAARGQGQGDEQGKDGREGESGESRGGSRAGQQGEGQGAEPGDGESAGEVYSATGGNTPGGDYADQGDGDGDGEAASGKRQAAGGGQANGGEGYGRDSGGAPLGRGEGTGTRGRETEARVANGAGPSRAEVIGAAAGRGFAGRGYARVFNDYEAAVEDALGATAVPEGKRYIVRRYFDLIRPRQGTGGKRP